MADLFGSLFGSGSGGSIPGLSNPSSATSGTNGVFAVYSPINFSGASSGAMTTTGGTLIPTATATTQTPGAAGSTLGAIPATAATANPFASLLTSKNLLIAGGVGVALVAAYFFLGKD